MTSGSKSTASIGKTPALKNMTSSLQGWVKSIPPPPWSVLGFLILLGLGYRSVDLALSDRVGKKTLGSSQISGRVLIRPITTISSCPDIPVQKHYPILKKVLGWSHVTHITFLVLMPYQKCPHRPDQMQCHRKCNLMPKVSVFRRRGPDHNVKISSKAQTIIPVLYRYW